MSRVFYSRIFSSYAKNCYAQSSFTYHIYLAESAMRGVFIRQILSDAGSISALLRKKKKIQKNLLIFFKKICWKKFAEETVSTRVDTLSTNTQRRGKRIAGSVSRDKGLQNLLIATKRAIPLFYIFSNSDCRQRFPLKSTEIWRYRQRRFGVLLKFPVSPLHSTCGYFP